MRNRFDQVWPEKLAFARKRKRGARHLQWCSQKPTLPNTHVIRIAHTPQGIIRIGARFPFFAWHQSFFFTQKINPRGLPEAKSQEIIAHPINPQSVYTIMSTSYCIEISVRGNSDRVYHIHRTMILPILKNSRAFGIKRIRHHNTPFGIYNFLRTYYMFINSGGREKWFYRGCGRIESHDSAKKQGMTFIR